MEKLKLMSREILFRGKRVDNGEWIYGSLVTGAFFKSATRQDIPYIFNTDECDAAYCFEDFTDDYGYYEVDPATVGQFTGLTDKNGVKIFEGDVVFNSNKTLLTLPEDPRTYEIVWSEGQYDNENKWLSKKPSFSFRKIQPNNKRYMELIFNKSQIEVIGNIHDNPELIRKEVSNG